MNKAGTPATRARCRPAAAASRSGKALLKKRGEKIERSFAHVLDSGAQRRTTLRGLDNINKRYLCAIIGFNLGLILRKLTGVGTPRQAAAAKAAALAVIRWLRECLDGYFRPAASPHRSWQENPVPAPPHTRYFPIFTPAGGNAAFSTGS